MGGASGLGLPRYSDYANISLPMFNQGTTLSDPQGGEQFPSGRVGPGGPIPIAPPSTSQNPFTYGFQNPESVLSQFMSPGFQRPPTQYAPATPGGASSALGGAAYAAPAAPAAPAPPNLAAMSNAQRKQYYLANPSLIPPGGYNDEGA